METDKLPPVPRVWPLDEMEVRISLRDYFAGQAIIGILGARNGFLVDTGIDNAPGWAYQVADKMLIEREKKSACDNEEEPTP